MRLLTLLYLLTSIISFVRCAEGYSEEKSAFKASITLPKVIDTLSIEGSFYQIDSMQSGWYSIAGIGCLDSVEVDINKNWWNENNSEYYPSEKHLQEQQKIQIIVDTSQSIIKHVRDDTNIAIEGEEDIFHIIDSYYKAYPVFIINSGDSISFISIQDASFIIIQEAKNKNGKWKPIEYWTYSWCGNSYGYLQLQPKHFGLTKIPVYKGSFETELRVKTLINSKVYYSQSFNGSINHSQFIKTFSKQDRASFLDIN